GSDRHLAAAGAGGGAEARVGVVAGADDGRVAQAAGPLEAPAAGGDGAGDVALGVADDDVGGAEDLLVEQRRPVLDDAHVEAELVLVGLALYRSAVLTEDVAPPLLLRLLGQEVGGLEAVDAGEELGTLADQHHVGRDLHDLTGDLDRVGVVLDGADRARREGRAVHDAGVELDLPEDVGDPARADAVVLEVVLDHFDRCNGGVERAAARAQDLHRRGEPDPGVVAPNDDADLCSASHLAALPSPGAAPGAPGADSLALRSRAGIVAEAGRRGRRSVAELVQAGEEVIDGGDVAHRTTVVAEADHPGGVDDEHRRHAAETEQADLLAVTLGYRVAGVGQAGEGDVLPLPIGAHGIRAVWSDGEDLSAALLELLIVVAQ